MNATTTDRPYQVGDRVEVTRATRTASFTAVGTVSEFEQLHDGPLTMWIDLDEPRAAWGGKGVVRKARVWLKADRTAVHADEHGRYTVELLTDATQSTSTGAVTDHAPAPVGAPTTHTLDRIPGEPNRLDLNPAVGFTAAIDVDSGVTWYERPTVWLTTEQDAALGSPQQITVTIGAVR